MTSRDACRLCGGPAVPRFEAPLAHGLVGRYVECERCGFLRSDHLDDDAALQAVYRAAAADDDEGAAWRQYCVATRLTELRIEGVFHDRGFRALDFGSATGFVPAYLSVRHGWDAWGFDAYSTPVYRPSRHLRRWEEVVRHGPFDLVVATEVLEHFRDPRAELERISGVLAPGGCLYATTEPYRPGVHDASWSYLAPATAQHCAFYSATAMRRVAELLGAEVLRVGGPNEWLLARAAGPARRVRAHLAAWRLRRAARRGAIPTFT